MKLLVFSTHEMKYFWYLPNKSNFSFYFITNSKFNVYLMQIKVVLSTVKKYRIFSLVTNTIFSSPEHKVLKVSYCDHPVSGVRRQSSVVRRPSCVVNNSFKAHLLLNYWTNFKIISHKCSPEAPLPKLLKWFRSAEQNGRQS